MRTKPSSPAIATGQAWRRQSQGQDRKYVSQQQGIWSDISGNDNKPSRLAVNDKQLGSAKRTCDGSRFHSLRGSASLARRQVKALDQLCSAMTPKQYNAMLDRIESDVQRKRWTSLVVLDWVGTNMNAIRRICES